MAQKNERQVSVIIPAFNEEENISSIINKTKKIFDDMEHEIIVVDDGSTDSTKERVRATDAVLIEHKENLGYGRSLKDGIRAAKYDTVGIIDADGSYAPKDLLKLLPELENCDMVIGKREGKVVKMQLMRGAGKFVLKKLGNFLSNSRIEDINSGLRVFKKKDIIRYFHLLSDKFSFTATSTLAYLNDGLSVKFMPVSYSKRSGGKSKIRPWRDFCSFVLLLLRTCTYFRPMRVFMPLAALLFIFGALIGITKIIFLGNLGTTEILLIVSAFIIGSLGLLADLIVKTRLK